MCTLNPATKKNKLAADFTDKLLNPVREKIRLKTNFLKANTYFIDLEVMSEQLGLQPDTSSFFCKM